MHACVGIHFSKATLDVSKKGVSEKGGQTAFSVFPH